MRRRGGDVCRIREQEFRWGAHDYVATAHVSGYWEDERFWSDTVLVDEIIMLLDEEEQAVRLDATTLPIELEDKLYELVLTKGAYDGDEPNDRDCD